MKARFFDNTFDSRVICVKGSLTGKVREKGSLTFYLGKFIYKSGLGQILEPSTFVSQSLLQNELYIFLVLIIPSSVNV